MYLLDANVLINANRDYYPKARVPEYWDWIEHHAAAGDVKLPREIYDEVARGDPKKDSAVKWVRDRRGILRLATVVAPGHVQQVLQTYGTALQDTDLLKMGEDPFLIAHALMDPANRAIVTAEVSAPSRQKGNRRIPDVARDLGVTTYTPFEFIRRLNFRTDGVTY